MKTFYILDRLVGKQKLEKRKRDDKKTREKEAGKREMVEYYQISFGFDFECSHR